VNSGGHPSTARAIWIVGRLALRRQINRWQSMGFGRKPRAIEGKRSGTPTKSGRRSIFGIGLFLLMILSGFVVSSSGVMRISMAARNIPESHDKLMVSAYTYARLVDVDRALHELKGVNDPAERRKFQGMWNRHLDQLLTAEVRWGAFTDDEEAARLSQMRETFSRTGASGFASAGPDLFGVSAATMPREWHARSVFLRVLSLLFVLWVPLIVLLALGINNKDLGQVEWSFEWLYTFPASARALFVSKLFVYSFFDQLVWWLLFPFAVLVYIVGGYRYAAVPFGLVATVYLAITAGCVSTVAEVVLRKFLSLDRLKNAQALFTVVGSVCLLLFYASMFSAPIATFLVKCATSLPNLVTWSPLSLPLIIGYVKLPAPQRILGVAEMIAVNLAAIFLALVTSEWLTRDGLVRAGGPYQGSREVGRRRTRGAWLRGIGGQEMLLLGRDRNLLVQVSIIPLLVPAYYLLIDPHLRSVLTGNFRRAAMVAFAVGAYSFVSSAIPVLSRENKTLWFLLSFPRSLVSLMLDKTIFWAAIGVLYGGTVLVALVHFSPHLHVTSWGYVFLVFYGIVLYAFIAAGIGILAADVFETEPRAQLKVSLLYLYFVLLAMYANIFYSASLWASLAQLVLTTLLAFALWQKVRDIAPYILDPTQWPPRTISLADGMIAALGFSVAQPLAAMLLFRTSLPLTAQITVAYMIAGLIVAAAVLGIFWMQRVPNLWREIGFVPANGDGRRFAAARGVMQGALWGGAAALGAFAYLHFLDMFSQWQVWKQDAELSSFVAPAGQPLWICALLIVAAPLLEEFLFRGLIFQGLRRTTGPLLAVVGSAALFALVHPPIAVIPIFGLGIATAISFNKSKFLLAPILAHAVYNSCMLLFNRL
jgi:ABC-2 type transport system permease protein